MQILGTTLFSLTPDWRAGAELQEYICQENNKYMQKLTDDFGQPMFGSE